MGVWGLVSSSLFWTTLVAVRFEWTNLLVFKQQKDSPASVRTSKGPSFLCSNTRRNVLLVFAQQKERPSGVRASGGCPSGVRNQKDCPSGARTPEGPSFWCSNTRRTVNRRYFTPHVGRQALLSSSFYWTTHWVLGGSRRRRFVPAPMCLRPLTVVVAPKA